MLFPATIKRARDRAGLTQKELAKQIGISEVTLSRYENSEREPRIGDLIKIANALNTTVASLIDNDEALNQSTQKGPVKIGDTQQNKDMPPRDSDVFATLGILINQLEKQYPNMTHEDQSLTRGLLDRCMLVINGKAK